MAHARRQAFATSAVVASLFLGCGPDAAPSPGGSEAVSAAEAALNAGGPASFCAHLRGGARSSKTPLLALSEAHANVRYFGANDSFTSADQALAKALVHTAVPSHEVLEAYVAALGNGQSCVAWTSPDGLPPAHVTMAGNVAVVRPGTGALALPPQAKAVALDLRGLPDAPGLRHALDAAAALALASPVSRPTTTVRAHYGPVDAFGDYLYYDYLDTPAQPPIPAGSARDLPLAVITEEAMAPASAELAGTLRLAGRAWLFGSDVDAAVAESSFSPVGEDGIAYRHEDLADAASAARWPDVITADTGGDPLEAIRGLSTLGAPPPATWGTASRPLLTALDPTLDNPPPDLGPGEARAGLLTVHGALRLWFEYFDVVGDVIDQRLAETLAGVDHASRRPGGLDRPSYQLLLSRMSQAIHDGHSQIYDFLADPTASYIPLELQLSGSSVLVRSSIVPEVLPGDTIVSVDGAPTSAFFDYWAQYVSAATPGWQFVASSIKLTSTATPRRFGIVRADGSFHDLSISPVTSSPPNPYGYRASGWLSDLGAPDVYYLDLGSSVVTDTNAALASIGEAAGARGMVVDMRKYPVVDYYAIAQALIPTTFNSSGAWVRFRELPGESSLIDVSFPIPPASTPPTYAGPIVLMVSNKTISAAEDFSLLLVDAHRPVHVVGQQSAGTDGNVTVLTLPGLFGFEFTGVKITHADGSRFHGVGIVPDIVVTPTPQDFAAHRDPELLAAISALP